MFTGIIEAEGTVTDIVQTGTNKTFTIASSIAPELKVDQSVSHNGVCLTVESIESNKYTVTAIKETLDKSNLGSWQVGSIVNLERSLRPSSLMDGHLVQGHVDTTTACIDVKDENGSWSYLFNLPEIGKDLVVAKGSICINGVSLTIAHLDDQSLGVAIIPYTFEHTNFRDLKPGDLVNIEFDVIGKYVIQYLSRRQQ